MFTLLSPILRILSVTVCLTSTVLAQSESPRGFFQTLFGGFTEQRAPLNDYSQRGSGGNSRPQQRKSVIEAEDTAEDVGSGGLGSGHYCVRSCDGFFFPIPAIKNAKGISGQEFCQSLCPFSEVELFKTHAGGEIDGATNRTGKSYSSTKTAFSFREKLENSCTCRGGATRGLARIDYRNDFTLRAGDVLVLEQGAHVFAGSSRFPYANLDFVVASKYSKLPAEVRTRLVALNLGPRQHLSNEPRLAQAKFSLADAQETSNASVDVRMIDIFTKQYRAKPSILIELIRRRS
jgi:hypothetical protein